MLVDLQEWLGYERVHTVEPMGQSGWLAMFVKKGVEVQLLNVNKNLMDVRIQFGRVAFYLSCIYGKHAVKDRPMLWERMSRIGVNRKQPWCMVGDFNDIVHNGEKIGEPRRGDSSFLPFKDMLNCCKMIKHPTKGNSFTWGGMRYQSWIQCKLDRSFGNKAWFAIFPPANQSFLEKRGSDRIPVLVSLTTSKELYKGHFRFDKRLIHKPNVKAAIVQSWNYARQNRGLKVCEKLRECRRVLSKWKKENNINSNSNIDQIRKGLEAEQSSDFLRSDRVWGLKRQLAEAHKEE
ncbi:hypothetical protein V5N11_027552 [Cardamine amara subsp. amara]|uniref:Endonuclease/exonuclease/phosphatase domain-containing protein n=1 Tax=Cardamine amara subsp. amara TaxID=228776 RepID=A0ABD0ZVQ8_CARAN